MQLTGGRESEMPFTTVIKTLTDHVQAALFRLAASENKPFPLKLTSDLNRSRKQGVELKKIKKTVL